MLWNEIRFVGFDTETSGPDPRTAEIVSACVGEREWLLQPTAPIPAAATSVHGITTEHATRHGVPHAAGIAEIRDAIQALWAERGALCVFNASYDCTVLDRECQRHGLGRFEVRGVIVDPYVVDKEIDRFRRGKRQLLDVARHYGVPLWARADAIAAAQLAAHLAPNLPSPERANAAQARSHKAQKESYAGWLERQGRADAAREVRANTEWPIRS